MQQQPAMTTTHGCDPRLHRPFQPEPKMCNSISPHTASFSFHWRVGDRRVNRIGGSVHDPDPMIGELEVAARKIYLRHMASDAVFSDRSCTPWPLARCDTAGILRHSRRRFSRRSRGDCGKPRNQSVCPRVKFRRPECWKRDSRAERRRLQYEAARGNL
jgi:hypothetical protein